MTKGAATSSPPPAPSHRPAAPGSRAFHGLGWVWPVGVTLTTLLVYVLVTPRVLRYTEPPTGDQPYYLQTAISILEDHDIDEYNNFKQGDYQRFYPPDVRGPHFEGIHAPVPLSPRTHVGRTSNRPEDEWYSKHGLGLAVLILPGWAVGEQLSPFLHGLTASGKTGWPGVVFEMNLVGALLAAQVFLLVWETTRVRWIALAVWAALAFANPQMALSFLIFPEVPAALCIVYAFRRLNQGWAANRPWQLCLAGVAIASLPWLHARLLIVALPLVGYGLYQWWLERRRLPAASGGRGSGNAGRGITVALFLAPLAVLCALWVGYFLTLYGTPLPNFQDHAAFYRIWRAAERLPLLAAALGLLLDQQWGLLIYAPIYALALAGGVAMGRQQDQRSSLFWLLAIVLPYGALIVSYKVWWGAWGPPARYLMPVTPLVALPLGQALLAARRSGLFLTLYGLLAGLGVMIMAGLVLALQPASKAQPPAFFNLNTGQAALLLWLEPHLGVELVPYVPAILPWHYHVTPDLPWPLIAGYGAFFTLVMVSGMVLVWRSLARAQQ